MNKKYIINDIAILAALAILLTACIPPETPSGGPQHSVQFADPTALSGTWKKVTTAETNHESGVVTYTYTDIWAFSGETAHRTQLRTGYSDDSEDEASYYRGTAVYRASDGMVISTMDEESEDGSTWTAMSSPYTNYDRNLVIDGEWHTTATVRIGSGSGIGGTWETIPLVNNSDLFKVRYTFNTGTGMLSVQGYNLDTDGAISTVRGAASEADFTWDQTTLTAGPNSAVCPMLPGGYLDLPAGGPTPRVFTKE